MSRRRRRRLDSRMVRGRRHPPRNPTGRRWLARRDDQASSVDLGNGFRDAGDNYRLGVPVFAARSGDPEIRILEGSVNGRRVNGSRGLVFVSLDFGQGAGPVRHWYRAVVNQVDNRLPGDTGVRGVCAAACCIRRVLGAGLGFFSQLPYYRLSYRLGGSRGFWCRGVLGPQQHGFVREPFGTP